MFYLCFTDYIIIHVNAPAGASSARFMLHHLTWECRHSRPWLFIRPKYLLRRLRNHDHHLQEVLSTRPVTTNILGFLEWSSREWLQCCVQVIASIPWKDEGKKWRGVWAMSCCCSSGFFLPQACSTQNTTIRALCLQSPLAFPGWLIIQIHLQRT